MKLFVHKILHFLMEKFPDPFHHNYNSGSRLKGVIAALIHTCVGQVKFRIANHRDSELKGSFETSRNVKLGKSLLVVANGPSSRILTQQALREINSESIDIMGVNDSILLRLNVPYQYHVLSDWVSFYETWTLINQEIRNGKSKPLAKLFFTPTSWHDQYRFPICRKGNCLHFIDAGKSLYGKNIDFRKLPSYPQMTAFKALAIAKHLGYAKIYVIGLDWTQFKSLQLDINQRIYEAGNYFHSQERISRMPISCQDGVSDYFHFISECFRNTKKIFGGLGVENLDVNTLIDGFPLARDFPVDLTQPEEQRP